MTSVAQKFTACDVCGQPATKYITSDYAWGGNPAYGSYNAYRCDADTDAVVAFLISVRAKWVVQPLIARSEPQHA